MFRLWQQKRSCYASCSATNCISKSFFSLAPKDNSISIFTCLLWASVNSISNKKGRFICHESAFLMYNFSLYRFTVLNFIPFNFVGFQVKFKTTSIPTIYYCILWLIGIIYYTILSIFHVSMNFHIKVG